MIDDDGRHILTHFRDKSIYCRPRFQTKVCFYAIATSMASESRLSRVLFLSGPIMPMPLTALHWADPFRRCTSQPIVSLGDIWRHTTWPTSVLVMSYCLTAQLHHLNRSALSWNPPKANKSFWCRHWNMFRRLGIYLYTFLKATLGPTLSFTQTSAVITWSNTTWYCIQNSSYCDKT